MSALTSAKLQRFFACVIPAGTAAGVDVLFVKIIIIFLQEDATLKLIFLFVKAGDEKHHDHPWNGEEKAYAEKVAIPGPGGKKPAEHSGN